MDNNLVILNQTFKKEKTNEEIEGLTVIIDGVTKEIFDKLKKDKNYGSYNDVLRDIIFEGVDAIAQQNNK